MGWYSSRFYAEIETRDFKKRCLTTPLFFYSGAIMSDRKLFIFLIFILFLAFGCFNPFAPELEHNAGNPLVVNNQETPEQVLENFVYAYTLKDSIVYANVLDSAFVFVYFDPDLNRSVSWNRDVDLKTTGRLFKNFETITLTWNQTLYQITDDRTAELSKTWNLSLFGNTGDFMLTGSAIFNFRKSPFDQKWRITRWKDDSTI